MNKSSKGGRQEGGRIGKGEGWGEERGRGKIGRREDGIESSSRIE